MQMSVPLSGGGLGVTKDLANQIERVAIRNCDARETVPQIVDAHPQRPSRFADFESTHPRDLGPDTRQALEIAVASDRRKHPICLFAPFQRREHRQSWRSQRNNLFVCL